MPRWIESSPTAWFLEDVSFNFTAEVVKRKAMWTGYINAKAVTRRKNREEAKIAVMSYIIGTLENRV